MSVASSFLASSNGGHSERISDPPRRTAGVMSADLKDLRTKITLETHCWLEAEARATGRDKAEIAREVLHHHALRKIREAEILDGLLKSEGLARK